MMRAAWSASITSVRDGLASETAQPLSEVNAVSGQPNILMFHVDNVSVGDFGCYGGAYPLGAKTPNIDPPNST